MIEKRGRKRLAVLGVLAEAKEPITSGQIAEVLAASGHDISDRSVRLYLTELEKEGLLERQGGRGCLITDYGQTAIRSAQVAMRVGLLSAKIDQMTYRMSFDLQRRAGDVVVNISIVDVDLLARCIDQICDVFAKGYAMGDRAALLEPGAALGEFTIPAGHVGFCTVCSITVNGVLLKHGVPTNSRFGGLLALHAGKPEGFVELIEYDSTSIDPLEVFIRSGMTDYLGAISTGTGRIGASFREFPADSRELVLTLSQRLAETGLGALLEVGYPGRPLFGIPVSEGRIGATIIGGLNPIAVLEERGYRVKSRALGGLLEFNKLHSYEELPRRLAQYR